MRQVSTLREVHAQDLVARVEEREERRKVGAGARVRLNIGVVGTEEPLYPLNGDVLDNVDVLASAVVPLARKPSAYLLVSTRANRREHGFADVVLGGDQLDTFVLSSPLLLNGRGDLGIGGASTSLLTMYSVLLVRRCGEASNLGQAGDRASGCNFHPKS